MANKTTCSQEYVDLGMEYVKGGWRENGEAVPTKDGLAVYLDVSRCTPKNWAAQENNPFAEEFAYIVDRVQAVQGMTLANGGLTGELNPSLAGKMLSNHGFNEKSSIDHTTAGQPITRIERVVVDATHAED